MKKQIYVFYKATSLVLAAGIFFVSCFTFQGCSNYEEDYSVLQENNHVPEILTNVRLPETNDLIVNLKESITTKKKVTKNLKSAYIDKIESKFGIPNWEENQLVTYDNGLQGIFVPLVKDEKISAFVLSKPKNNKFKSVIIEVISENKEEDELFSGSISFYTVSCGEISSYFYKKGKYIPSLNSTTCQLNSLKSASYEEGDCSLGCLCSCISEVLGTDPLYAFLCGLACGTCGTVFSAFICITCIGGPALYCLDQCCEVF